MRTRALSVLSLFLTACPSPTVPPDAADVASDLALDALADAAPDVPPDAPLVESVAISASDTTATLTVAAAPTRLRLARPDGTAVLTSPTATPFIELGVRPASVALSWPDVRVANPRGITWRTPARVVSSTADSIAFDDERAGRVTVRAEVVSAGVYLVRVEAAGDTVLVRVNLQSDDGAYLGLGERFGATDARGTIVPMQLHVAGTESGTNETHVPVPFFVDTRGYGLFARTRESGAFDVAATDPAKVTATFEGNTAEFLFFVDDPVRVVAAYSRISGLPRLPPLWAHGHQQWRNAWRNRTEVLEDARRLRSEGVPTTTLWIDNPWQRSYNDAVIDETRFSDPAGLLRELQSLGFRVLFWSTPYLDAVDSDGAPNNPAEQLFVEHSALDHFVRQGDSRTIFVSPSNVGGPAGVDARGGIIDFTNASASRYWSDQLRTVIGLGARAFKLDYGEEILVEIAGNRSQFSFNNGQSERTMHSLFPHGYHRAYRTALDDFAGGDGFLLVRASSWGGQSVCDIIWPGDLDNDFRPHAGRDVGGLPAAVHALINLSASGFPSFASDTGGYRGGRPTREALLRWAEASALAPYMQLGGGGESHNPWTYTPDATPTYRSLARLHDSLIPYFRRYAELASRDGTPPVRALSMAYPSDAGARRDPFAYMLGDDLYAAPVVTEGATQRAVHIPSGTWVHWLTRAVYTGPADVMVDAPLGTPPFFVRQGAVIPLLPEDVQTLVDATESGIVDLADRTAILRVRSAPAAAQRASTADGASVEISGSATEATVNFVAGATTTELRATIDWLQRAGATSAEPTTVLRDATALPRVTAEDVARGCDGCWHWDATERTLRLSARGAARLTIR